jgi:AraC family transcriptional regulator
MFRDMTAPAPQTYQRIPSPGRGERFAESEVWAPVRGEWRPLLSGFYDHGFSVEWHDFEVDGDLDWSRSFHPRGLEICLNLNGQGEVEAAGERAVFSASTAGFYFQRNASLRAVRRGGERHQFITIEYSLPFLREHLRKTMTGLDPLLSTVLRRSAEAEAGVAPVRRLSPEQRLMAASLRRPTVAASGLGLWYRSKALECAAQVLYTAAVSEEFFCERHRRLSEQRVERVVAILRERLQEPPSLQDLARQVSCSPFYLSRLFAATVGQTISAYLRELRLARASELLREGRLNVTEVAMAVGYSSPSHFSSAFHAFYGCCPGLYPLRTRTQGVRIAGKRGPASSH